MNRVQQGEVESLKKELIFLSGLLENHQAREACYQRPQFHSNVPYRHSNRNHYSKVKPQVFNHSNLYKSKCHGSTFNTANGIASGNITARNYFHKQTPVSVQPKSKTNYCAKGSLPWKYNKISNSAPKLYPSPSETVRTAGNAVVPKLNGVKDTKFDNSVKPGAISDSVKNSCSESLMKNKLPDKSANGAEISYLTCSDCVIEISEYANGELHITKKKVLPDAEDSEQSNIKSPGSSSDLNISGDVDCSKSTTEMLDEIAGVSGFGSSEGNSVYSEPVIGLEYTDKAVESNVPKVVDKLANANLISERECILTCKLTKSQPSCSRTVKYSNINRNTMKSAQNSPSTQLLKNKYSIKKVNVLKYNSKSKCKVNREMKKFDPHSGKYTYIAKLPLSSAFSKNSVDFVSERTVLPAKHVRRTYASCSQFSSSEQSHTKKPISLQQRTDFTRSGLAASSCGQILGKAKVSHLKNVYKVVNKSNPVPSRVVAKHSPLLKGRGEKRMSGPLRAYGSDKKWSKKVISVTKNFVHDSPIKTPLRNLLDNQQTKGESKEVLHNSRSSPKLSGYKLKNLNGSKIVTRHTLQRIPQKKNLTINPSLSSPLHKTFLDSHTPSKRAKKIRLSKTTYKIVNKHVSHVSQVVQMIKTKYRTVNKRSTSNSHLKWLHEQKRTYLKRKFQRRHVHAKGKWTYSHSATAEHFRKHPILHPKTSRKQVLGPKKVLKEIHGVTYKVSKTKINKSVSPKLLKKNVSISCNRKNSMILNVRGNQFQLSPGGRSLKRLGILEQKNKISPRRIKIGGSTYVQQKESPGYFTRFSPRSRNLASRVLHRSIHTVRAAQAKKTLQKSNTLCMFFNRFGRCNKEGDCPYIHDPSKIAVCTRFLRGTCKIDGCPFSHEVSPGKMAICSFFLQGNCRNSNCPFQHTSIKPGTRLCKAFVKEGYCSNLSQCQDAHIQACPQLICKGFCEKGSLCKWPHPPVKKNISKTSGLSEVNKEKEIKEKNAAVNGDITDLRYFTYEPDLISDQYGEQVESLQDSSNQSSKKIRKIRKKKKFYKQPEFLSLHVSDEEF